MQPQDPYAQGMPNLPPQFPYSKNYFSGLDSGSGIRYRLGGEDMVSRVVEALRGGVTKDKYGKSVYNEEYRMMNDLGISRIQYFLHTAVNKNTHLTKYRSVEIILSQMREISKELAVEMAANRRRWDVRDADMVQITLEKQMLESMQRGDDGFEANLSSKQYQVTENLDHTAQRPSLLSKLNPFNFMRT